MNGEIKVTWSPPAREIRKDRPVKVIDKHARQRTGSGQPNYRDLDKPSAARQAGTREIAERPQQMAVGAERDLDYLDIPRSCAARRTEAKRSCCASAGRPTGRGRARMGMDRWVSGKGGSEPARRQSRTARTEQHAAACAGGDGRCVGDGRGVR